MLPASGALLTVIVPLCDSIISLTMASPSPVAALGARPRFIHAEEAVEDMFLILFRYTDTVVFYNNDSVLPVFVYGNFNHTTRTVIFNSIVYKIDYGLLDGKNIAFYRSVLLLLFRKPELFYCF